MYEWALKGLGKLGWIAAFVYCAAAALRLARFNTNIAVVDRRYFQGLPSPAAAAVVVGFLWVVDDIGIRDVSSDPLLAWTAFGLTLFAGLTMVTNAPFYSFKDISLKRSVPFAVIVVIALGIALINVHPPLVLFGIFLSYGASGYVLYAWRRLKGKPVSVIATSTEDPDEVGLHR
jgi:CDP-diacylglycerol--serine O-phosphatidyltransferase